MKNIKISTKAFITFITIDIIIVIGLYTYFTDFNKEVKIEGIKEKAKSILMAAEGAREYAKDASQQEIYKSLDSMTLEQILYTVPIFTAMEVARKKAEDLNYEFKVPKVSPRNAQDNSPDEYELRILDTLRNKKYEEFGELFTDKNGDDYYRYFRPVILTQECMACHGDPATSMELWGNDKGLDPTGTLMEDWKVGSMHGAFEIKIDMKPYYAQIDDESAEILIISLILAFIILITTFFIVSVIKKMVKESISSVDSLKTKIGNGELDNRADQNAVSIDFKGLIISVNSLIDTFVKPIKVSQTYVNQISNGDIPEKITEDYKGDFNESKDNLNTLIDNLNNFKGDMISMSNEHNKGDIDNFIDESKFNGTYKEMAQGVNAMVSAYVNENKNAMAIVEEYGKGNFNKSLDKLPGKKIYVNNTLDNLKNNLTSLTTEVSDLVLSAREGDLTKRADSSSFYGDWAVLVNDINNLVDGILTPIDETVATLERMAKGDLSTKMTGEFKGDHAKLKNAINTTLEQMPLYEAIEVLEALAHGDFTKEMSSNYQGDAKKLSTSLNQTIDSMNDVLGQVTSTVREVQKGSLLVADTSQALSQGATEQAASLEEITSSMNEIGSQTRGNAENANKAQELTNMAKEAAQKGNVEMEQLNSAMGDITKSSNEISKIIKVIDEIAFQTNLLALNAAVEAARAGKHGKGFAVVAEEVRNLAARSATAAKETSDLIENSMASVTNGANLAAKTGDALVEIEKGSISAAEIVEEIANSSSEQALGVSQINEGLHQIDNVTQQNTASSEEAASAAEELQGQSNNLQSLIDKFILKSSYDRVPSTSRGKELSGRPQSKSLPSADTNYEGSNNDLDLDVSPESMISLDDDDFGKY